MVMNLSVTPSERPTDSDERRATTPAAAADQPTATGLARATVSASAAPAPPAAGRHPGHLRRQRQRRRRDPRHRGQGRQSDRLPLRRQPAEAWLQGTAADGELDLTRPSGGNSLTGTFGNGVAAGDVTAAGRSSSRSRLKTVAPPSGLYRATADVRDAKLVGGWIVLADGDQVGPWSWHHRRCPRRR